ncbi:hypothetical protein ACOSP7_028958 [Xanthoceras sorbifolium]|uniref:Uncharacterized protein n=1 Tax=Xanthoceras sorbifolium TaxID=99658 RepID=A0ABQ8HC37_9ROSI|nr:hypothetical protein JRO89_XS12G0104600 [Xanthoceras sorbifolium]
MDSGGVVKDSSEIKVGSKGIVVDMEDEEEDLFEIDLEAVDSIPPPHYFESYFTATTNTLLANCLLPISDVSSAIPMVSTAFNYLLQSTESR